MPEKFNAPAACYKAPAVCYKPTTSSDTTLNDQQAAAATGIATRLATAGSTSLLIGYAGTGKTYTVSEILKHFDLSHFVEVRHKYYDSDGEPIEYIKRYANVCIAAPTYRALMVLKKSLSANGINVAAEGIAFRTIHSVLGMVVSKDDEGDTDCTKQDDTTPCLPMFRHLIIDECSMLGKDICDLIDIHRGLNTSILYTGDDMQLPPPKDKAKSRVFSTPSPFILSKVMRQDANSDVVKVSMMLRAKQDANAPADLVDMQQIANSPDSNILFRDGGEVDAARFIAAARREHNIFVKAVIDDPNATTYKKRDTVFNTPNTHALAYSNKMVFRLNRRIHQELYPNGAPFVRGEILVCYKAHSINYPTDLDQDNEYKFFNQSCYMVIKCAPSTSVDKDYPNMALSDVALGDERGRVIHMTLPNDPEEYLNLHKVMWDKIKKANAILREMPDRHSREYKRILTEKDRARKAADAFEERYMQCRFDYALTFYKAQGGSHKHSVIMLKDLQQCALTYNKDPIQAKIALYNSSLYVGITRPKEKALILFG